MPFNLGKVNLQVSPYTQIWAGLFAWKQLCVYIYTYISVIAGYSFVKVKYYSSVQICVEELYATI